MKILRVSLESSSSTSYLVSGSPVAADAQIITPQRKEPEPFFEPNWASLLNLDTTHLGEEDLAHQVKELQRGLASAQDCIQVRGRLLLKVHMPQMSSWS
jgi:hypothetical protein